MRKPWGKYEEYRFFKRDVLVPAVERINANTDISVTWEPVKMGRSVKAIKFFYITETGTTSAKPLRPRLPRRPHVIEGSDKEGAWARKCIAVMQDFRTRLEYYDSKEKLPLADLKKWLHWYEIIGDEVSVKRMKSEITGRSKRKTAGMKVNAAV